MFFNGYYGLLLFLIPLAVGMWAQLKVILSIKKYSRVMAKSGYTGAHAARMILDRNGLADVRVERVRAQFSDHFDPKSNVIRLSDGVYDSASIAAIGVAAHECGHAIQHASGYTPMKIRHAIIPVTNIGSRLAVPLVLIGLFFDYGPLLSVGLIGYLLVTLFQLVTLPVELNASSSAMAIIDETQLLDSDEKKLAEKVLTAAALTYVAALLSSVTQLLRILLIYGDRHGRR